MMLPPFSRIRFRAFYVDDRRAGMRRRRPDFNFEVQRDCRSKPCGTGAGPSGGCGGATGGGSAPGAGCDGTGLGGPGAGNS
jgi:hypothetical protein